MENIQSTMVVMLGFLLRLAIPIVITILLVVLLRNFDKRWQASAEAIAFAAPKPRNPGCWDVKHCSAEQRATCNAYAHPDTPCWQLKRNSQGLLQQECLGCSVFSQAVPATISIGGD
jgi:hypothetical protein